MDNQLKRGKENRIKPKNYQVLCNLLKAIIKMS